jgi:hypothetical protein
MSAPALPPDDDDTSGTTIGAAPEPDPPATLSAARLALQRQLVRIGRSQTADGEKYSWQYSDLAEDVEDVLKPVLCDVGLLWSTLPTMRGDRFVLAYSLEHVATSETVDGEWPLGSPTASPQALGSATTYGRRYALLAACGIAPRREANGQRGDDDGQAATREHRERQQRADSGAASVAPAPDQRPRNPRDPRRLADQAFACDDIAKADQFVAWVQQQNMERTRVPVAEHLRERYGFGVAAPTLLDIANAVSRELHDRDHRAADLAHAERNSAWSDKAADVAEQLREDTTNQADQQRYEREQSESDDPSDDDELPTVSCGHCTRPLDSDGTCRAGCEPRCACGELLDANGYCPTCEAGDAATVERAERADAMAG